MFMETVPKPRPADSKHCVRTSIFSCLSSFSKLTPPRFCGFKVWQFIVLVDCKLSVTFSSSLFLTKLVDSASK